MTHCINMFRHLSTAITAHSESLGSINLGDTSQRYKFGPSNSLYLVLSRIPIKTTANRLTNLSRDHNQTQCYGALMKVS